MNQPLKVCFLLGAVLGLVFGLITGLIPDNAPAYTKVAAGIVAGVLFGAVTALANELRPALGIGYRLAPSFFMGAAVFASFNVVYFLIMMLTQH